MLEFFYLTPLPGSEDHRTLLQKGVWMDPDLNKYDLHHRVSHHGQMTDQEWEEAYRAAWKNYYSQEHIETVARRHGALPNGDPGKAVQFMTEFKVAFEAEGVHPLEGGILRMKYRTDRRPGMPIEPPVVFHARMAGQFVKKLWIYGSLVWQAWRISQKVKNDPRRHAYTDIAITPVVAEELDSLALFQDTTGGEAAVAKKRSEDLARERVAAKVKVA